jgi:hypothetical protein
VSTGDGRYGWKPRIVNGSHIRHTIQEAELTQNRLYWDRDLWDALWPTFFAHDKYDDRNPIQVTLPDDSVVNFSLEMFVPGIWGTPATSEFWNWFHSLSAQSGDHLLFEALDGEAKQYRVRSQRRADRDEAGIATRNQALVDIGSKLLKRPYGIADWKFTTYLLASGFYRHPIPPDPFSELWHEDTIVRILYGEEPEPVQPDPELLTEEQFTQVVREYDFESPFDLPRAYDPDRSHRHARKSRKARYDSVTSFTLRVNHRALPEVCRDIELAEDNTLEDLHLTIQLAFHWRDDHLYSFFLTGSTRDLHREIGSPWSDTALHTH